MCPRQKGIVGPATVEQSDRVLQPPAPFSKGECRQRTSGVDLHSIFKWVQDGCEKEYYFTKEIGDYSCRHGCVPYEGFQE